ncbi:MAG: hypothetical protein ABSG46_17720, partial [Candidatus Binataceae bacterium]
MSSPFNRKAAAALIRAVEGGSPIAPKPSEAGAGEAVPSQPPLADANAGASGACVRNDAEGAFSSRAVESVSETPSSVPAGEEPIAKDPAPNDA